jgi:uncharacterized protein YggU (UPF0235/DUF167 family)
MRVTVTVKPGSKVAGIESTEDGLLLRVRERAVDGAANDACIRALAKHFKLAPSRITLVRGARSRKKLFDVG